MTQEFEKNIDYYVRMRACLKCGIVGHFRQKCSRKFYKNPKEDDTGRVLVVGREVRVLDDLGGTHSFIMDRKLNVPVCEDTLCSLIKSVYPRRKNVWLLCQTETPYTGVYICI